MLEALRRLEAANRFAAPAAPEVVERIPNAPTSPPHVPESIVLTELDEPPFEPTFGPLVSWNRESQADRYASHAIDDALDVLDSLASEAAEATSPERLVTVPIHTDSDVSPVETQAGTLLDEFDPVAVVSEHCGASEAVVEDVGVDHAGAVAEDVLSTIQFAEHWATIALGEYGVAESPPANEYPPPPDDFALPSPAAATHAEESSPPAAVQVVVPPARSKDTLRENTARPEPSSAELAALLDLNDAELCAQYTQLGQRMLSELSTTTTKSCAAIVSVEHQPHLTDVALRTAMSLCRSGKQVLLIDAALADKQLTNGLLMPVEFGLSEVLKGRIPWQQAVRATATPGLCVLPAGRLTPPRLADDDHRLKDVLKELTSQWDLVLLDGGSLAETSARYVAAAARNVYLVVRLGETDAAAAEKAVRALTAPEIAVRGCIVTNAA
jgi:Mrp family chromosome partitioning ATPase